MDNLPLLRDIHLPAGVSAFPPGYGWFLMAALLIMAYFGYRLYKYIIAKSKKYYALNLLRASSVDNLQTVRQISEILRRVCLYKYKEAATLFGREWIKFLNQKSRQKISGAAAELLVYAPYMPVGEKFKPEDYQRLKSFAQKWIGENL